MKLRFRAPGEALAFEALLARVLPDRPEAERRRLLAAGALQPASPGCEAPPAARHVPVPQPRDREGRVAPGSPWLLEAPDAGIQSAPVPATAPAPRWQLLAPRLAYPAGELPGGVCFEERAAQDGVAHYAVWGARGAGAAESSQDAAPAFDAGVVLTAFAEAGSPVLGDLERGGIAVTAGLALRSGDAPPGWPAEPVLPPDRDAGAQQASLAVSGETLHALDRGHPWVLRDSATGDTEGLRPGARLGILGAQDGGVEVRVEPAGPVAARIWARGLAPGQKPASIEARVAAALARRASLHEGARRPDGSDAYRLIHGEADGLPGIHLDRLGGVLRLLVSARCAEPVVPRLLDAVASGLSAGLGPDPTWIGVTALRDPPAGRFEAVRILRGPRPDLDAEGRLRVRERGLGFFVDPGLAEPARPRPGTGLFLDQRVNRARVAERVRPGGRYLNLFAHTGAFSVALLAAGAGEVVSVDLSAAYLRVIEENLAANPDACDPARHRGVRSDGRRYLEQDPPGEPFDGIVLDPPTAAAAGRRFWSVKRDLDPLVTRALQCLAPGGWLLLSRNDRHARGRRAAERRRIEALAGGAGLAPEHVAPAPPGPDFPRLKGFPEGDPFRGWLVTRPH